MPDPQYQEYLAHINQANIDYNISKNTYNVNLAAAQLDYLQSRTDDKEYYNSDDEDERVCTAAPQYPQTPYHPPNISYENVAKNNKYLAKQTPDYSNYPKSTKPHTHGCPSYPVDGYTHTHYYPKYYSKKISCLKYVPPKCKTTFSLAYKKPIAKVYVYNNYIKTPHYENKKCYSHHHNHHDHHDHHNHHSTTNYCTPSTTKATYTTTCSQNPY